MRKVKYLMFQEEETETNKMLLSGTCTMVWTNSGMSYTLMFQSLQSISFQTSHSFSSIRWQERDFWHSQDLTLLLTQETTVQSNSLNSIQHQRQSRCSQINFTHWLYHTLVSQETWLLTRLMEPGTNTLSLTVNSLRMKEAWFLMYLDQLIRMDKMLSFGRRMAKIHWTNIGQ